MILLVLCFVVTAACAVSLGNHHRAVVIRAVALALLAAAESYASECPPGEIPPEQWEKFRSHDFVIADDARLQDFSLSLLPCLDAADPAIRDGLAIDALTTWLRNKQIRAATARRMVMQLIPRLTAPDAAGFGQPFAALALAELARMDRIDRYLTDAEYAALVVAASDYLKSVRDYRGFDEREGWRHGVAHGADALMQLALNPRTTKAQLDAMLEAIATQVVPPAAHFYVYGEGGRLARPVVFIAQRQLHSMQEWRTWFAKINAPASFKTQLGLAMRHNRSAFLNGLYVLIHESDDGAWRAPILEPLSQALRE